MSTPSQIVRTTLEDVFTEANRPTLEHVCGALEAHGAAIAAAFYSGLFQVPEARVILAHEVVEKNLHASMRAWVADLANPAHGDDLDAFIARQRLVGQVHARADVPMRLVNHGIRMLKKQAWRALLDTPLNAGVDRVEALMLVDELLDLAVALINEAYVDDMVVVERDAQALRMSVFGNNVAASFERMRVDLHEFHGRVVSAIWAGEREPSRVPSIRNANVGLWITHKVELLFASAPEAAKLQAQLTVIDDAVKTLIAAADRGDSLKTVLGELQRGIAETDWMLGDLLTSVQEEDKNRDPLTRAFNRRFLPPILQRETQLSVRQGLRYALLMIDIDHFKAVNDHHSHLTGDLVLNAVAERLITTVRDGDFVFRYGGEEFLVLLSGVTEDAAQRVAEKIRERIAGEPFTVNPELHLEVTVSIGLCVHNGHPDYSRTIAAADAALYQAKAQGRNRCVLATEPD